METSKTPVGRAIAAGAENWAGVPDGKSAGVGRDEVVSQSAKSAGATRSSPSTSVRSQLRERPAAGTDDASAAADVDGDADADADADADGDADADADRDADADADRDADAGADRDADADGDADDNADADASIDGRAGSLATVAGAPASVSRGEADVD